MMARVLLSWLPTIQSSAATSEAMEASPKQLSALTGMIAMPLQTPELRPPRIAATLEPCSVQNRLILDQTLTKKSKNQKDTYMPIAVVGPDIFSPAIPVGNKVASPDARL